MLSQTLATYQTAWLTFWSNTAYTIATISNCFEECQLTEIAETVGLDGRAKDENKKSDDTEQDLLLMNDEETGENKLTSESIERQLKEDQLGKEIDLINVDDSLDLNLFSDTDLMQHQNSSKISQELQARKKQVDDLLTSSADSEDLILLNDILNWSSSEKSFFESSTSNQLGQFSFMKTEDPDKSFSSIGQFSFMKRDDQGKSFSGKKEADQLANKNQQQSKSDSKPADTEKKKWADLFSDLDVFNPKNRKQTQGDC